MRGVEDEECAAGRALASRMARHGGRVTVSYRGNIRPQMIRTEQLAIVIGAVALGAAAA
jgi:hypothetical protein